MTDQTTILADNVIAAMRTLTGKARFDYAGQEAKKFMALRDQAKATGNGVAEAFYQESVRQIQDVCLTPLLRSAHHR